MCFVFGEFFIQTAKEKYNTQKKRERNYVFTNMIDYGLDVR